MFHGIIGQRHVTNLRRAAGRAPEHDGVPEGGHTGRAPLPRQQTNQSHSGAHGRRVERVDQPVRLGQLAEYV